MDKKINKKLFVFGIRGIPNVQGGVERHCESLYPLLSSHYKITIFRRKSYINDNNKQWQDIRFIDLPSTKIKGFETVLHSFLSAIICIAQRPIIVHIHNIGPGLFTPLLRLFGLKVVITYHSPNYEHSKWNYWQKKLLIFSEFCALNFANQAIFVNKTQCEKIGAKYSCKSNWIPNGVKPSIFSESREYIQSLGLTEKKYILAVGRITPEKGFDYLIKAYKHLKNKDFKLVIAGDSDHSTAFSKQMIKEAQDNNVILTGFVTGDSLYQLYTHAQLFVLPSFHESLSMSLLEAMSYNLDILVSNIPANKEINLPENCYFTCGDWNNLYLKLNKQLSIKETPAYDLSLYDWNNIALQTLDVYKKIFLSDSWSALSCFVLLSSF